MGRVLVAGALHLDVVVRAERLPRQDETLIGRSVDYVFGGKGGNQAVAAARMGAAVSMAGRVGSDGFATTVFAALDAAGVERSQVVASPGATGMSVAIVEEDGEYGAVVVSGVNRDLSAAEIVLPPDLSLLVLQNEVSETVNAGLTERVPASVFVILNAAPARQPDASVLRRTDLLVVNRVEAAALAAEAPTAEDAARSLCAMGPKAVIVTLGADGLVLCANDECRRLPAFPVQMRSAHGAGDMFVGALAARLDGGDSLFEGARFGAAAAALHVSSDPEVRSSFGPAAVHRLIG